MIEINKRKEILCRLGAEEEDISSLLEYTENRFSPCEYCVEDDAFLEKWTPLIQTADILGAASAINLKLVKPELQIDFNEPELVKIELFESIGGVIPVISTENIADFENMVLSITYKGKEFPDISKTGASFSSGKTNRFLILSNKPYSNIPAEAMELDETVWREKSMIIRQNHECAHYYTKRYFGSSKMNLHDELIADFCGIYAAFSEYKAEWFLRFLGLAENSNGESGRITVYVKNLSEPARKIVEKIAVAAAHEIEKWTKDDRFYHLNETQRIKYLCEKELLSYAVNLI